MNRDALNESRRNWHCAGARLVDARRLAMSDESVEHYRVCRDHAYAAFALESGEYDLDELMDHLNPDAHPAWGDHPVSWTEWGSMVCAARAAVSS